MPPVTQVAQQISQEENQQQNGPNLSSLQNSLPAPHSRKAALPQQVQPAGWDKKHVLVVLVPVPSQQQKNEILQQITALRKEGLWSLKHLPKLHGALGHKSHHDYLLEEMQWMATDFVQERRWKMITAKRHVDCSLFGVIGMENQITCYEAQILPRLKVAIKVIEDIYCSPSSPRLEPGKLKSNSHTQELKSLVLKSFDQTVKGVPEDKRQLKECLDKMYFWNERHCSRAALYGRDLLETCSWISERKISQHCSARINKWHWAGFANCLPYSSTSEVPKDPLQELILTVKQQRIALKDVITSKSPLHIHPWNEALEDQSQGTDASLLPFNAADSRASFSPVSRSLTGAA